MGYKFNTGFFDTDKWEYADNKYFLFNGNRIHISEIKSFEFIVPLGGNYRFELKCLNGRSFSLRVKDKDFGTAQALVRRLQDENVIDRGLEKHMEQMKKPYNSAVGKQIVAMGNSSSNTSKEKDASVIGRAVAGQIIAGPAGAVVGALSAVDKNNKNRK